jgi:hypothetical protein
MIAIGCLVQWYEIEMVEEYFNSLIIATKGFEDKVIVDLCLCINQDLEKIDNNLRSLDSITTQFNKYCDVFSSKNINLNNKITKDLYTIADYRRDFNLEYCNKVDILMWGESDMLVPSQAIQTILLLNDGVKNQTPKWLGFFATCKMWDDSWKIIEHPKLTDLPRDPYAWYGTRAYMDYNKMEELNQDVTSPNIIQSPEYKFNGCGLFFSSSIVKSGANIPPSVFFTHEDTGFMNFIKILFEKSLIPFYIVKNILLVHNREHPKKRLFVQNESGDDLNAKRKNNNWYKIASKYSEHNAYTFNTQNKQYTWEDVWNTK